MQRIDELTEQLQTAIKESFEYKEFLRLSELVDRNPDVKIRVNELRREIFRINNCGEDMDIISAGDELYERYKDIREIEYVNQYLSSELRICRMVAEICRNIADAVDMDMDFL